MPVGKVYLNVKNSVCWIFRLASELACLPILVRLVDEDRQKESPRCGMDSGRVFS